jgi:hypothetical protein
MSIAESNVKFGHSVWWLVGAIILGLALPAVAATVPALRAFYPVGAFLTVPEPGLGSAFQAILGAATILIVVATAAVTYFMTLRPLVLALIACFCMLIGTLPGLFAYYAARDLGYYLVTPRSEALIDAIELYEKLQGRPPASLDELTPDFPLFVPDTGMPAFPRYEYQASAGPCSQNNSWSLVIALKGTFSDERLYYCPLQDYDLEPIQDDFRSTERQRIGDWVYSYTDLED